jgi:hypothetical protein
MATVAYPTVPAPVPRVRMRATVAVGLVLFFVGIIGSAILSFSPDIGDALLLAALAVIGAVLMAVGGRSVPRPVPAAAPPSLNFAPSASWSPPPTQPSYPAGVGYSPPASGSPGPAPVPPPPPVPLTAAPPVPFCTGCGRPTTFIEPYGRYYCYSCARYA